MGKTATGANEDDYVSLIPSKIDYKFCIHVQTRMGRALHSKVSKNVYLTLIYGDVGTCRLKIRITLSSKLYKRRMETTFTTCCELVKHLLEISLTDHEMFEMSTKILQLIQTSSTKPMEYAEPLWNRAVHFERVYDEYVFQGIFIERQNLWFRHSCPHPKLWGNLLRPMIFYFTPTR